jgi:hypothetical protein
MSPPPLPVRIALARGCAGRIVVTCVGLDGIAELDLSPRLAAALASELAEALARLAGPEIPPRDDW